LICAPGDGTAVTGAGAASLLPPTAKYTLPVNFWTPGKVLRATLLGRLSNLNPTPGNLTVDMRFGSSTVVANSGAMALNAAAANTNVSFKFELFATCRAIGVTSAANLMFQWIMQSQALSALTTAGAVTVFAPASAPAVGGGFDSTIANVVDFFALFSTSNAANTIQLHQFLLEMLN
jgi:hypothetical protein